ncbi:MAG: hypothetical protein GWP14_08545 [Actinobacteria bacterium]|nr:hypothetical protein [Actinomycetota bacterium]
MTKARLYDDGHIVEIVECATSRYFLTIWQVKRGSFEWLTRWIEHQPGIGRA